MNLEKEILIKILEKEEIRIVFSNLKVNIGEIIEKECYELLLS